MVWYLVDKLSWLYRIMPGEEPAEKLSEVVLHFSQAFSDPLPSFHPMDLLWGLLGTLLLKGIIYSKSKNAKKFRFGEEFGSARWATREDILPYIDEKEDSM